MKLNYGEEAVREQMIFDPRVVAERKRVEPMFLFIHKFFQDNNIYFEILPKFKESFQRYDRDRDQLLNKEEF